MGVLLFNEKAEIWKAESRNWGCEGHRKASGTKADCQCAAKVDCGNDLVLVLTIEYPYGVPMEVL
jgi:hypothetical protein